jgi:hypothetical protein
VALTPVTGRHDTTPHHSTEAHVISNSPAPDQPTAEQQARRRSPQEEAVLGSLLAWADRHNVPVTIRDLEELVPRLVVATRMAGPRQVPGATPKAGATAADARRIAARLEAGFAQPADGERAA